MRHINLARCPESLLWLLRIPIQTACGMPLFRS